MKLTEKELNNVNGGAKSVAAIIICGGIVFVAGVLSGWKRPSSCKSGK